MSCRKLSVTVVSLSCLFCLSCMFSSEIAGDDPSWRHLFDGKTLKGWEVVGDNDFPGRGQIKVEKGNLVIGTGAEMTGVRYTGAFPRSNYEVVIEAMRQDGFDFFCGTVFPVGAEYCSFINGGWGDTVVGLSNVNDMPAVSNETTKTIGFENNKWYRFRLRVTDAKIQVWIDKDKVIDLPRKDRRFTIRAIQEPQRPFGIATWCCQGALRCIKVRDLSK